MLGIAFLSEDDFTKMFSVLTAMITASDRQMRMTVMTTTVAHCGRTREDEDLNYGTVATVDVGLITIVLYGIEKPTLWFGKLITIVLYG